MNITPRSSRSSSLRYFRGPDDHRHRSHAGRDGGHAAYQAAPAVVRGPEPRRRSAPSSTPPPRCTACSSARSRSCPTLRGRTVVNLFFEDSTRTRSSFEIAGKWLSADVINISGKGSSTSKGESLRDTVLTVAAMGVDALVIRHHASGAAHQVSQWVDAHVINAGDGMHEHPTQALLDAYTMERRLGDLEGRHVVIVGDLTHSRVVRSNLITLQDPRRAGHPRRAADPDAQRHHRLGAGRGVRR